MLDSASGLASLTEVGSFPGSTSFTMLVPNETPLPSLTAVDFLGGRPRFFLSLLVPVLVSTTTITSSETEGGSGGSEEDCGGNGGSGSSGAG